MSMILTAACIKGGTGKSTTLAALAQAAVKAGKKVLAIDLDPQANLSFFIGADQTQPGSYEVLHGADPAQLIQHTAQGVDAITASPDLATEKTSPGSAKRLQKAMEAVKKRYGLIVIDTAPAMNETLFNALQAATGLIIPLEADNSSLQGLYQIVSIATQMQKSNPELSIIGSIITRYDARPKLNRYLKEVIADRGKETGAPLLMAIRPGIAIREAQALQQSIFDYAPKSKPAQDYQTLYDMLTTHRRRK